MPVPVVGAAPGLAVAVAAGTGGALPDTWTSLGTITPRLVARASGCWTFEGWSSGDTSVGGLNPPPAVWAVAQASRAHPIATAHGFRARAVSAVV